MNTPCFQPTLVNSSISNKPITAHICENILLIDRNLLQDSDSIILTDLNKFRYSRNLKKEFATNENSFYIYERL